MNKSTYALFTCLVVATEGGYEAIYGNVRATGKTDSEATRKLAAKLEVVPRKRDRE